MKEKKKEAAKVPQAPPNSASPEGLTRELASKVLEADDANILAKAKSGKPLSKFERERIEQIRDADKSHSVPSVPIPPAVPPPTGADWETKVCVNMKQAVALLNEHGFKTTFQQLRALTKDAAFADAFRGNRVYLEKLLPPMRARLQGDTAPASGVQLEIAKAEAELRIKEARATQEEAAAAEVQGKFTETQTFIDAIRRLSARLGFLRQKLLNEAPSDTAGKTLAERREYFGKIYDDTMKAFAEFADEFKC